MFGVVLDGCRCFNETDSLPDGHFALLWFDKFFRASSSKKAALWLGLGNALRQGDFRVEKHAVRDRLRLFYRFFVMSTASSA